MMLRHVALLRNVALQLCSAQQPAVGVCLAEAAAAAAAPAALCSTSVLQLARSMQQQADLPSSSRASLVLHSVTSEEEMCSTRRPLDAPLLPLPPASAPGGLTAPALRRGGPRGGALLVQYPSAPVYYTPRRTPMFGLDGTPRGAVQLPGAVFNTPVRADVMHAVVRWQRARARQGTHKVKSRAEVSGSGRKPWQQKGTGRARHGSRRSPIWVGGGVAHGPVPRSYAYCLNKKVRRLGLRCALSAKANEGRLLLLDSLQPPLPKTKVMATALQRLLAGQPRLSALLVDSGPRGADGGVALRRAARNIPGVEVLPAIGANVQAIMRRDVLVLTRAAADAIAERLSTPINRLGAAGTAYVERLAARRAAAARSAAAAAVIAKARGSVQDLQQAGTM